MAEQGREEWLGEFEIIARYFRPLAKEVPGAFALSDDAARVTPPAGAELVVTTDTLVAGVHFREGDRADDIGWKALAVNISDLVAKGAQPLVYLLALALPKGPDPAWLQGLADGLGAAQAAFGCRLTGGDTTATPGPVTLTIAAIGAAPEGAMVRRAGARTGDRVYVTGTIGDAALGLALLNAPRTADSLGIHAARAAALQGRYWRPMPPVALVAVLRAHASAAMDVSDGLAGDFGKLCAASGVGGEIRAGDVPLSEAVRAALARDPDVLPRLLAGGDDYEVLATVPEARAAAFEQAARKAGVPITAIGCIRPAADGVAIVASDGTALALPRGAYEHF